MIDNKYLLATDLDGTFVGDEEALGELLRFFEKAPFEVGLVYVTGRHLTSALELMEEEQLPQPDLLIADVGTAIYEAKKFKEDIEWKARMQAEWQPDKIAEIASSFPSLTRQELPDNRRVSFIAEGESADVEKFKEALNEQGVAHQFIFSSNCDIDVLPKGAGKGNALEYMLEQHVSEDVQLLVAGDSGNDRDMLSLGHPAVIVGNAQPELRELAPCPTLFRANGICAAGIHEAWLHFYGS